jgi:pilus assembly protein CpaB
MVSVAVVALTLARASSDRQSVRAEASHPNIRAVNGATVVVATQLIGRGERIQSAKLALKRIEGPPIGTPVNSIAAAEDAVALATIQPGQIIVASDLAGGPDAHPGLAMLVPDGMRAVALRVNDEVAVGNFVSPGDRVDIQVVFSAKQAADIHGGAKTSSSAEAHVLLQDIGVLSAGQTLTTSADGRPVRMQNITVAVTPKDAQLLAVAKETGSFYLALRNPVDHGTITLPAVLASDLSGKRAGKPVVRRQAARDGASRRIQVIEGQTSSMRTVRED